MDHLNLNVIAKHQQSVNSIYQFGQLSVKPQASGQTVNTPNRGHSMTERGHHKTNMMMLQQQRKAATRVS